MKKKDYTKALHVATAAYIKSVGGKAVVTGGIEIQKWPGESEFKYKLAISILGKPPPRKN